MGEGGKLMVREEKPATHTASTNRLPAPFNDQTSLIVSMSTVYKIFQLCLKYVNVT